MCMYFNFLLLRPSMKENHYTLIPKGTKYPMLFSCGAFVAHHHHHYHPHRLHHQKNDVLFLFLGKLDISYTLSNYTIAQILFGIEECEPGTYAEQ